MASYQCMKCRYRFSRNTDKKPTKCPYCGDANDSLTETTSGAVVREIEDMLK